MAPPPVPVLARRYQASLLEEASRAASFDHRRPRLRRSAGSAACSFFGAFTTAPSLPVKDAGGEGSSRAASIDSRGLCWNGEGPEPHPEANPNPNPSFNTDPYMKPASRSTKPRQ